jgi:hypothetical protein
VNSAAWQPIAAEQLRIGHFVRIGDRWFDHPFLQSRFRITTPEELSLIRAAGLSRLFVDPSRSQTVRTASGSAAAGHAQVISISDTAAMPEIADAVAGAARLKSRKATHAADVRRTRENLVQSRQDYLAAVERATAALGMLGAGEPQGVEATRGAVRDVLALAAGRQRPLTLAPVTAPVGAERRHGCLSRDAAALAAAVGRRLRLSAADLQTLTTAALLHTLGLSRIPPQLRDEARLERRDELREFREYPRLGAETAARLRRLPPEVVRIVRQHRERLDGSGFPARDVRRCDPPARAGGRRDQGVPGPRDARWPDPARRSRWRSCTATCAAPAARPRWTT